MRRNDPFSTPARRRRIIAELSKKVLRQYCLSACENVHRWRIETKAALYLQCCVRQFLARQKVYKIRYARCYKAAVVIQCCWRVYSAKKKKLRLRRELHYRQCMRLVHAMESLWEIRKARLFRVALAIARRIALEKRRNLASLTIQRYYRGYVARKRFRVIKSEYFKKQQKRRLAAIEIQKNFRRYSKRKKYRKLLREHRAKRLIARLLLTFLYRLRFLKRRKRNKSAIIIQCATRIYLSKKKLAYLRLKAIPPPPQIITESLDINMQMSIEAIILLAKGGVLFVLRWCLHHGVLRYNPASGFTIGSVVKQVIRSVEQIKSNEYIHSADDLVVKVPQWEVELSNETPPAALRQSLKWGFPLKDELGAEVSFSIHDTRLEVCIISRSSMTADRLIFEYIHRISVSALSEVVKLTDFLSDAAAALEASQEEENIVDSSFDTAKMRFQNAVVYVPRPDPIALPPPVVSEDPPVLGDALLMEISQEESSTPQQVTIIEETPVVIEEAVKPIAEPIINIIEETPEDVLAIAPAPVIRITLQLPPSPPKPPPIDYDLMASKIQRMLTKRLHIKQLAALIIKRSYHSFYSHRRWQSLVFDVLQRAQRAIVIMQCAVRQFMAKKRLRYFKALIGDLFFPFGHDFRLTNEEDNWSAFGLKYSETVPFQYFASTGDIYLTGQRKDGVRTVTNRTCNPVVGIFDYLQMSSPPNCFKSTMSSSYFGHVEHRYKFIDKPSDDEMNRVQIEKGVSSENSDTEKQVVVQVHEMNESEIDHTIDSTLGVQVETSICENNTEEAKIPERVQKLDVSMELERCITLPFLSQEEEIFIDGESVSTHLFLEQSLFKDGETMKKDDDDGRFVHLVFTEESIIQEEFADNILASMTSKVFPFSDVVPPLYEKVALTHAASNLDNL